MVGRLRITLRLAAISAVAVSCAGCVNREKVSSVGIAPSPQSEAAETGSLESGADRSVLQVVLLDGIQLRIREYIENRYPDPKERAAMERIATAQQQALIRGTRSRSDARAVAQEYTQTSTCMRLLRGVDNRNPDRDHSLQYTQNQAVTRESKELLGRLLIDDSSISAYSLYMKNLSGQAMLGTTPDECERGPADGSVDPLASP